MSRVVLLYLCAKHHLSTGGIRQRSVLRLRFGRQSTWSNANRAANAALLAIVVRVFRTGHVAAVSKLRVRRDLLLVDFLYSWPRLVTMKLRGSSSSEHSRPSHKAPSNHSFPRPVATLLPVANRKPVITIRVQMSL